MAGTVATLIPVAETLIKVIEEAYKVYESAKAGKVTPEEAQAALANGVTALKSIVASNNATIDSEIAAMPHADK